MIDLDSFEDLAAALQAGTDDDGPHAAAVNLLIETRSVLEARAVVAEYVDLAEDGSGVAWVDWEPLAADAADGTLMRPAREVALVRIAASLTGAAPVPLGAELEHLTADDAAAVARAIVTAARADQGCR